MRLFAKSLEIVNFGKSQKIKLGNLSIPELLQGVEDPAWCQSKLRHGLVQPFTRLYNGSWIFSALSDRIGVILKCPDGQTPTALMGFGVINLAEGCTITRCDRIVPNFFLVVYE